MTTKLSVSLSESDVAYIDELARARSGNRSAAIHDLVRIARERAAVSDYAMANDEWIIRRGVEDAALSRREQRRRQ